MCGNGGADAKGCGQNDQFDAWKAPPIARLGAELLAPGHEPMFDTTDQILSQIRAGEDGRAEFKAVRLGERGVLSPNTEDLPAVPTAWTRVRIRRAARLDAVL